MKVITNADGTMRTVNDDPSVVTAEDVARTRRGLRDMLDGNTPFHVEKKDEPPLPEVPNQGAAWVGYDIRFGASYMARQRRAVLDALAADARRWKANDEDYGVNRDA
jgi:hypothetical protein